MRTDYKHCSSSR